MTFSMIKFSQPTNFIVLIRNFLQAPPPMDDISMSYLNSLQSKKIYDYNRRQDPLQNEGYSVINSSCYAL